MKVWIVHVTPFGGARYLDTIWASVTAATERKADLERYMKLAGNTGTVASGHVVCITMGRIEDATLTSAVLPATDAAAAEAAPTSELLLG